MQEFSPGFKGLILLRFFHSLICGIIFTFLKPDILAQLFLIVYFLKRSYKEFCEFNNTPVSKREFALGVFYPALFIIIMTGIIPDVIVLLYRQVMFYLRTHSFRPYFFMSLFSTLIENIVIAIIIVMLSFRFYMKTKSPWFSAICAIIAIVIIPSLVNLTVTLLINPVQTSNGIIWKIVYNALLYSIYFLMIRSIGNTIESDLYPRYNAITHEKGNWLA